MSDMDTLIVTFQTQLSDVMETIVRSAMYEVTRLVEDGFMEEVRRRNQEMELLRTQLQWAERKLSDHGEKEVGKTGRCVDCGKDDVELSPDEIDTQSTDLQYDLLRACGLKEEGDSVERWARSCRQEGVSESAQDVVDKPSSILTPALESQTVEDGVMPPVDMKEEEVNKPSCSAVQPGGWAISCDGETGSESHSSSEMTDTQAKQAEQNTEELLRSVINQDLQSSTGFPEDQEDTHMVPDPSYGSPLEMDSKWVGRTLRTTGLLQNHMLGNDKDCEMAITTGSLKHMDHKLLASAVADEVLANPQLVVDQISSSGSPKAMQMSEVGGVVIKQEVIVDSDLDEEEVEEREIFSRSGHQHRVRSQLLRQNPTSSKASAQGVMKMHSKVGTGLALQAAVQHLRRPMRRPPHPTANHSGTAAPATHCRINANLPPLNRIPSTSKGAGLPLPPPLSVQRAHLGDKQAAAFTRTGAPWVSVKSHHQNPHPHPGSHPQPGPRHLLRCGQCGKCFPHPSNLKAHLQTHTGERPFCCSLCGRSFTKLSNLKAHRRVHTGERPYCCVACGKRFTQKCNLKRHQRIHLEG